MIIRTMMLTGLLFLFFSNDLSGQAGQYDNTWVFGMYSSTDPRHGGSMIDFNDALPYISFFDLPEEMWLGQMSVISDASGNLVAYTNGCRIADHTHQVMAGGDTINPGENFERRCTGASSSYSLHHGLLFLPIPGSDSLYYLFHLRVEEYVPVELLYTVVNRRGNGGRGQVEAKNQVLLRDVFADQLTAVRHGNGRDWWIMIPQGGNMSRRYYTFLFSPEGIQGPFEQEAGNFRRFSSNAQAVFSPNGRNYIVAHNLHDMIIFDFDRCTGLLSNPRDIWIPATSQYNIMGLSVSPSSRYLYASTSVDLHQYDLYAANIFLSRVHIGSYDGYRSPLATTFFQHRLAPDGKIYMSATNGVDILHVIHEPDSAGTACRFEQHGVQLPRQHAFSMPNLPWYRLYDWPGSPCDTLGINLTPEEPPIPTDLNRVVVKVYPNPASGQTQVALSGTLEEALDFKLYEPAGRMVWQQTLEPGSVLYPVSLERLPAGVYFWVITGGKKLRVQGKLIVVTGGR